MRLLAIVVLLALIPVVALGIHYIPLHDGSPYLFLLAIVLPAIVIGGCTWLIFPRRPG